MINFNQIKIEDILKKGDNLIVIAIVCVGLVFALKINGKNSLKLRSISEKINSQKKINTLISDINVQAQKFEAYKKAIFFKKDSSQIVNMLNEWAKNSKAEIISLRPLFLKEVDQWRTLPIEIEAKDDFYGLGQFLSLIESYGGFIDIVSLRLDPVRDMSKESKDKSDLLNISLSLQAFMIKDLDISEAFSKKRY